MSKTRKTVETAKLVEFIAKLRAKSDVWHDTAEACEKANADHAAIQKAFGKSEVYANVARELEQILKGF